MKINFYLAAELTQPGGGDFISVALVDPAGSWFYAEVVDFAHPVASQVRERVLPKLKKITDTRFLRSRQLTATLGSWMGERAMERDLDPRSLQITLLVSPSDVAAANMLREALAVTVQRALGQLPSATLPANEAPVVTLEIREARVDEDLLEQLTERCGGVERVGGNSMIRALFAAVCDVDRVGSLAGLSMRRFELLLGSRHTASLRAWIRKFDHEARTGCYSRRAMRSAGLLSEGPRLSWSA